jgi:hypothetical protein
MQALSAFAKEAGYSTLVVEGTLMEYQNGPYTRF